MATVTHIIRSRYDPADRETLELETGQRTDNKSDPWQTESSFSAQHRVRAAPSFVPATISYDEWGVPSDTLSTKKEPNYPSPSPSSAEWYRSLTAASISHTAPPSSPLRPSSVPTPGRQDLDLPQERRRERSSKNDWFISKVLRSEPSTKPSSPAPSLADLLARDPPPLPSEERFKPPVWLHIGPSNRGFGMLQRSGWNEGEGLGAHIIRPVAHAGDVDKLAPSPAKMDQVTSDVQKMHEVIDLTLSDSETSEGDLDDSGVFSGSVKMQVMRGASVSYEQTALLTPLPTILKADRLGIGLKAKTDGPYKQSKKRVTHSAAALAAHIRSAKEMRKKKVELGKGKRGFAKAHKKEEDWRKSMLSYLND